MKQDVVNKVYAIWTFYILSLISKSIPCLQLSLYIHILVVHLSTHNIVSASVNPPCGRGPTLVCAHVAHTLWSGLAQSPPLRTTWPDQCVLGGGVIFFLPSPRYGFKPYLASYIGTCNSALCSLLALHSALNLISRWIDQTCEGLLLALKAGNTVVKNSSCWEMSLER